jgi:aminomethyltransferase
MNSTAVQGNPGSPSADFGDVRAEFDSLVSDSGVYDLSSRVKIALTGSDRVRWLNGMVTNNVRDLRQGHGLYAFLLNPQGRILGDLYAYNRGDSLMIDSDQSQSQKLLATFDHFVIMDDVKVANLSDQLTAIGIAGPKAREVLRKAGLEISNLAALEFVDQTWQSMAVNVVRSDNENLESYE